MSAVETTPKFVVKEDQQPMLVYPSIIGLPVAEQSTDLSNAIKKAALNWLAQQGQYQRADVTLSDRLEIGRRFWDEGRQWGEVSRLAEEYSLSRVTIYTIAERLVPFFQPRLPGPVAGLKELLSSVDPATITTGQEPVWTEKEIKQLRGRLILTGLFPGGMPMRSLEELLAQIPGFGISDSTIWRQLKQAGIKADQTLRGVDFSPVSANGVIVVIDETFFDDRPIFFAIEARSLALCDFYIPPDGKRTAEAWATFLLLLKEDRGLKIIGAMGDGAKAYPAAIKELLGKEGIFRGDHFHLLNDLYKLRRKLENKAYRAFKAEYKAQAQYKKKGTDKTEQKLVEAQAKSLHLAQVHDQFAEYVTWVVEALQFVDLTSGEIRDRQTNEWLLDEAIAAMAQVDHKEVIKISQHLHNHKAAYLAYLDDLKPWPTLQNNLTHYLQDPALAQTVARAIARYWRLQHEVESNNKHHFRPARQYAQQERHLWIANDPFMEQWAKQLYSLLDGVLRTSSAVENINSIFKALVKRKKRFANSDYAHNFVALFALWHNTRLFKEGLRQGKSPFGILGIDLGQQDWRTLLGYPPLQ